MDRIKLERYRNSHNVNAKCFGEDRKDVVENEEEKMGYIGFFADDSPLPSDAYNMA